MARWQRPQIACKLDGASVPWLALATIWSTSVATSARPDLRQGWHNPMSRSRTTALSFFQEAPYPRAVLDSRLVCNQPDWFLLCWSQKPGTCAVRWQPGYRQSVLERFGNGNSTYGKTDIEIKKAPASGAFEAYGRASSPRGKAYSRTMNLSISWLLFLLTLFAS